MTTPTPIDWSVFDKYPEDTCSCRCGHVFRSHAKSTVSIGGRLVLVSRKACPECGRTDNLRRVSSDPEVMTIRKGD